MNFVETYYIHRTAGIGGIAVTAPVANAISAFCRPSDLTALEAQYGSRRKLAEANLAAYSDTRPGTFALLCNGVRVAEAEYGCVSRPEWDPSTLDTYNADMRGAAL